ncbi:MAG: hypothetical protein WC584_01960 [Candidatus Pacearchaeota archaeon]
MKDKKGQVTIFIIIALLIVGFAVLIYIFYPKISVAFGFGVGSPQEYLATCIEDNFNENVLTVSSQGGSLNPENYFLYKRDKIEYLCYTEDYYKTCVMQKPLLKSSVETEIKKGIKDKVNECVGKLKTNYERKGYSVSISEGDFGVELLPKRVVVNLDQQITLRKGEDVQSFGGDKKKLSVVFNNNLYELTSIASSVLNSEATYGDAETTIYMDFYHDLKVEKYKQTDGTKVYILTDRNDGNKFQFATRSVAWPPGYGFNV